MYHIDPSLHFQINQNYAVMGHSKLVRHILYVYFSVLLYSHGMLKVFVVFVQYLVVDGFSFCMDVEMMVRSDDYCCHETTYSTTTTGLFLPFLFHVNVLSRSLSHSLTYLIQPPWLTANFVVRTSKEGKDSRNVHNMIFLRFPPFPFLAV